MYRRTVSTLLVVSLALLIPASAAAGHARHDRAHARRNGYTVDKLVSDQRGRAMFRDPKLVNAWGLVAGPSTPWWVADNGSNFSTLYGGDGSKIPLNVRVGGAPTGTVFNGSSDFVVHHGGESGPSLFLFSTESGYIRGWNPGVPTPAPSGRAFVVVNRHGRDAIYKGLAIAWLANGDGRLYATDFGNARVDVFDGSFHRIVRRGAFVDPRIPDGWAPFGIQTIGNHVFVTFAKQNGEDEVDAPGLGYVDMFSLRGRLLDRVATRHQLNAPWGLAWAPNDFGRFSDDLLVGNFGDGLIHAYRWAHGGFHFDGTLRRANGRPVWIDGLWAIEFGNDGPAGPSNSLYFTAGPDDESHGLFGSITAAS